jgi:hypothetical protein
VQGQLFFARTIGTMTASDSTAAVEFLRQPSGASTFNETHPMLELLDVPQSGYSGTYSPESINVTVGLTTGVERFSVWPNVPNSGTAVAAFIDTTNALTTTAKLFSFRNNGSEVANIGQAGGFTGTNVTDSALSTGQIVAAGTGGILQAATAGAGIGLSAGAISSNAVYQLSFQPGLVTSITGTTAVYSTLSKASTVDNIVGSALNFTCATNPTITMYECGTSATCATPTAIGTVTVTAAGTRTNGTVTAAAVTAGDSVGWAITAGVCTSLDLSVTAQVHSN